MPSSIFPSEFVPTPVNRATYSPCLITLRPNADAPRLLGRRRGIHEVRRHRGSARLSPGRPWARANLALRPKAAHLGRATIRRKLSSLSSLCEASAAQGNPVDGVKWPKVASQEGSTPTIGDHQARALLAAPDGSILKGLRVPLHRRRPARSPPTSKRRATMTTKLHRWSTSAAITRAAAAGHYIGRRLQGTDQVSRHGRDRRRRLWPHALRAKAITNALEHNADLEKVQDWLPLAGVKPFWPQTSVTSRDLAY